jgi:hypothetical protein
MKLAVYTILWTLALAIIKPYGTNAQGKTVFSVETDPSTFLLNGYSLHVRIKPAACEKLLIGAGTYGLDLPDLMVDLNPDNRNEGWNARIRSAYSLFGELYFREANQRWFIGEQIGLQNFKVQNDYEVSGDARFSNFLALTYLGYSWHPGKKSFYIKPWAGLGYTQKISGSTDLGSMHYDVAPLFPFITFHLGYSF